MRQTKRCAARKSPARTPAAPQKSAAKPAAEEGAAPAKKTDEERRQEALDLIVGTVEALVAERGDEEKVWGSMVKQALKRRKPGFNESYYAFRSFNGMLEEAERRIEILTERGELRAAPESLTGDDPGRR